MPVVVADDSSVGRSSRKARNPGQSDREIDPNSSRFKPTATISSILFSSSSSSPTTNDTAGANDRIKKKKTKKKKNNFTSATFRGLGCTASSQVSVPAAIRSSATWETKKLKKKRLLLLLNNNNNKTKKNTNDTASSAASNPSSSSSSSSLSLALSSSCVGVPDVWCAPGIGAAIDVAAAASASVDSVVSRRPPPARGKLDGVDHHIILPHRDQRPYTVRRMVTSEDIPFLESDTALGMHRLRSDVYGSRHHRHVRHGFREGLAEIVMLQRGRSDGIDRYRDLRLDVDNMSYEELVELGERIGYVSTGLREDEIACCLRTTKFATWDDFSSHFVSEKERKCSICQEEYEADDEMGKLKCGHFYHIDCIKQWLGHKNSCPICKTAAALPLKPNLSSS